MSDATYLSVIHKETGKLITAFQLENDATWIGRGKDKLIATSIYCNPGENVGMVFVETFKKANGKRVHGYFRAMPNQPTLKSISGESYGHKKAKENIYAGIYSGEIKIDNEPLDKELVKNILLEHRSVGEEYIITDVMVLFKDVHPKYGLGIFFEIQLSKQTNEETIERHYARVIEGFSGVWLTQKDFTPEWKLAYDNINIESHRKLLCMLEEYKENNFIKRINNYGDIIDKKLINFENDAINVVFQNIRNIKDDIESYKKEIIKLAGDEISKIEFENKQLKELKDVADKLDLNKLQEQADGITFKINEKADTLLNQVTFEINQIKNGLNQTYKKINDWRLGEVGIEKHSGVIEKNCEVCGKSMKIGKSMSGHNWYCIDFPKCDGFIKGVGVYEN